MRGKAAYDCQKEGEDRLTFTLRAKTENPLVLVDLDDNRITLVDGKTPAAAQYAALEVGSQVTCDLVSRTPPQVRDCATVGPGVAEVTPTLSKPAPTTTATTPTVTPAGPAIPAVGTQVTITPSGGGGGLLRDGTRYTTVTDRATGQRWVYTDGAKPVPEQPEAAKRPPFTCTVAPSVPLNTGSLPGLTNCVDQ